MLCYADIDATETIMATQLPESIEVVQTPRGTLWRLPPIEAKTWGGFLSILLITLFWWGVLSVFLYGVVTEFFRQNQDLFSIFFNIATSLFLLPFIGVGLLLLLVTLSYWAKPRAEITIGAQFLYYTHGSGFLVRTEKRDKSRIREIKVAVASRDVSNMVRRRDVALVRQLSNKQQQQPLREAILIAADGAKRPLVLAEGYSRDILIPLANALTEICATDATAVLSADPKDNSPRLEIEPPPPTPAEIAAGTAPEPLLEKPANSKAVMVNDGTNVTFILPPRGLLKSSGLLIFSIIWLGFVNFMFYQMLFHPGDHPLKLLPVILFPLVFEGVGVGMLIAAIHNARKKAVLIASQTELLFSQVSPFRTSEKRWDVSAIQTIACDESGTRVNDVPLMQLQIIIRGGKKHGLLTGRDPDELAWLAQTLRKSLHLAETRNT